MITKAPASLKAFRREFIQYASARDAFSAFLAAQMNISSVRVLLPAFIGWSPREGSGVFDPVSTLKLAHEFYQVDERLRVDIDDFRQKVQSNDVVVLIHYFGYVDPAYVEFIRLAREVGAVVLEDEAHAMFTDLVGGGSGRAGDAAIFSLHKMLPFKDGGTLIWNDNRFAASRIERAPVSDLLSYDLLSIAQRRRANALYLQSRLARGSRWFEPLWPAPGPSEVPQTFPILVRRISRFALYERLQAEGFGVVALYHTLIPQIDRSHFPAAHRLAETILNLPVHQDVCETALDTMLSAMNRIAAELEDMIPCNQPMASSN